MSDVIKSCTEALKILEEPRIFCDRADAYLNDELYDEVREAPQNSPDNPTRLRDAPFRNQNNDVINTFSISTLSLLKSPEGIV